MKSLHEQYTLTVEFVSIKIYVHNVTKVYLISMLFYPCQYGWHEFWEKYLFCGSWLGEYWHFCIKKYWYRLCLVLMFKQWLLIEIGSTSTSRGFLLLKWDWCKRKRRSKSIYLVHICHRMIKFRWKIKIFEFKVRIFSNFEIFRTSKIFLFKIW